MTVLNEYIIKQYYDWMATLAGIDQAAMQKRLADVKERYFLYPFSTALALVRLRAARLRNATAT